MTVEPGQSSEIKVTLNTSGKVGTLAKTITVVTNDPGEPNKAMNVTTVVLLPAGAASHPEFRGAQEILKGDCAGCHVTPGLGKRGETLFQAACGMCHGDGGEGKTAGPLNQPGVILRDEKALFDVIAKGIQTAGMPGFLKGEVENGPYDRSQLDSLVRHIKGWQKKMQTQAARIPADRREGVPDAHVGPTH